MKAAFCFALAYNSRTGTDTRSELGTRFDVRWRSIVTPCSLRARLAWAHDWVSDLALAAVFQTLPGASFVVDGATPAKNSGSPPPARGPPPGDPPPRGELPLRSDPSRKVQYGRNFSICDSPALGGEGWRTFQRNHAPDIAAMDLFVVPTIGFDLLYVFVIVRLARRDLVWINVTPNPTAEWVARQITEAFPWAEAPRYLIRDRDRVYGAVVTRRLRAMGIRDKPIAPASPWQNGFAERLIGSIRRECVDHFVVLSEAHLRRILQAYARYYDEIRTYRSLNKDAPTSRPVEQIGSIASHALLGGLHHHYVRV